MTNRVVCICANGNESTEYAEDDGRDGEAHKERAQAHQICINLFKLSLQWACSSRVRGRERGAVLFGVNDVCFLRVESAPKGTTELAKKGG